MKALMSLLVGCFVASATPAFAQVERVLMRTTGISCGTCAAVSEINLRRLVAGIDRVTISKSTESIVVYYKPGATFQPRGLRDILRPLDVGVLQFDATVRGRVQEEGGKRVFVAGKDKFALVTDAKTPKIALGTPVVIQAIVDDRPSPVALIVTGVKPANP